MKQKPGVDLIISTGDNEFQVQENLAFYRILSKV